MKILNNVREFRRKAVQTAKSRRDLTYRFSKAEAVEMIVELNKVGNKMALELQFIQSGDYELVRKTLEKMSLYGMDLKADWIDDS